MYVPNNPRFNGDGDRDGLSDITQVSLLKNLVRQDGHLERRSRNLRCITL